MSAGGKLGDSSANVINFEDPFLRHRLRVRSLRVVVADDQPANRIILQRLLEKAGHRTVFAENGEEVLDIIAHNPPDLMIVDLHMPGLSGVDVIRQARVMQAGQASRTPIIVLSADATVESIKEAQRAGAYLYMTKPISLPKLLDTLSNIATEVSMQTASDATGCDTTQSVPAPKAVDSTASVLEELAGMGLGEEFLREFVEQCMRDISRCMGQLQSASKNADYDGMRESAHAMRGVAESIGAIRLVERCCLVMRVDNTQLAKQAAHLTRDLDVLVEQTAREVYAQLPQILTPNLNLLDPKPGPDPL